MSKTGKGKMTGRSNVNTTVSDTQWGKLARSDEAATEVVKTAINLIEKC